MRALTSHVQEETAHTHSHSAYKHLSTFVASIFFLLSASLDCTTSEPVESIQYNSRSLLFLKTQVSIGTMVISEAVAVERVFLLSASSKTKRKRTVDLDNAVVCLCGSTFSCGQSADIKPLS